MLNEVHLELSCGDGHRVVCGNCHIEPEIASREVARKALLNLVEDILNYVFPPQPRQSAEESIIDEIRRLEGAQCK